MSTITAYVVTGKDAQNRIVMKKVHATTPQHAKERAATLGMHEFRNVQTARFQPFWSKARTPRKEQTNRGVRT